MEVTGLAVGTLGLASLFKTCLDLYDAFDCGSRHGVEYEILAVKVEVEKLRLALWGESMGFVRDANSDSTMRIVISDQLDPRLRDQRIVKAVADVLHCMENLFRDTEKMKRRYGLQQDAALRDPRIEALSGRALMSTFKQAYERFKLSAKTRQATADLNTMAKWAVRDKKKFQRFVDELRGFNDSLSSLFPDTDAANRAEIVAGIQAGTNVEELDLIEKAVEDEYRDMADAASARITLISQYPVDDNLSAFDDDTTTVGAHYEEKLEKLVKQLDKTLELKCVGALSISMWNTYGNHYSAFQTWDGIRGDDYLFQKERDMELVRHPFLSWNLFYGTERKKGGDRNPDAAEFGKIDPEAARHFEGKYPGTRSITGYAAEFHYWAETNMPGPPETTMYSASPLPEVPFPDLVQRIQRIQRYRAHPWGISREEKAEDLAKLVGKGGFTMGSYDALEVINILTRLNSPICFDSLIDVSMNVGLLIHSNFSNFLHQMCLAWELSTRLNEREAGGFAGITPTVIAAMEAMERFLAGVKLKSNSDDDKTVEIHSIVHERQTDGLIRFAELFRWPYIEDLRTTAEDAYTKLRSGETADTFTWNWLMGLVMPGASFANTLLSALVLNSPSVASIGGSPFHNTSLILPNVSYWRSCNVTGRVLGGIRDVKGVNGWVGPCPAPITTLRRLPGWVVDKAKPVEFRMPDRKGKEFVFSTTNISNIGETSRGEWAKTVFDRENWVIPAGPAASKDEVEFLGIHLKEIPNPQAKSKTPDAKNADVEPEDFFIRTSLAFSINNQPTTFTLTHKPTFIASPHCLDPSHVIHRQDLPLLQCIRNVSQLKGYIHHVEESNRRVLVINASGEGEELVARAWCAEYGTHAVVRRRGGGACFACAVRSASSEGLGVGVLIWCD